ncbi:Glucose--fructose oxidoreductase [Methylobacterium mesophilicum]|uniref:Gfo/Idh/MocA family protein n=1 Tax=Methylobacterium mesophilicum TaxID=39956 RepID=UPI001EE33402|nr:Gfo/Idh/MocA family oxidoreductase [Methylobacterium mesophilicum]GJE21403.1 Glucose--fructose oxidoreductase [Methylobacterium mesophilicum]
MADDTRLSRRTLLAAGGALAGAGLGSPAQAAQPGPAVPADTGAVQGGRVMFPNWRGPADRPPAPSPAPQPPGQRVGYCVVGLGRLSLDEILPAFGATKRSRLAAVMSGTPDKAKLVARQYGLPEDAAYGYDEWDRLKANASIQAVYIVTPNSVHRDNVLAAAAAGKQVLCEKPMAVASQECRDMIAACNQANVKLMIAYRCQYEPHNRAVIKLARSGEFGRPRMIQAFNGQTSGLPEQWRLKKALAGGGSLPDIGLYCLNTTRAVLGEEPDLIQAQIHSPPDDPKFREVEETVTFTMRFPSGVIAQCTSSYGVYEARSLMLHTGGATVDLQNAFAYEGQRLFVSHRDGKNGARDEKVLSPKNQFALEMDHFSRCIQENLRPRTPGEEGLQDQVLMEAIYEAARTGAPVKVGPPAGAASGLDVTRGPEPEEPS